MDSPEQAPGVLLALEGDARGASKEACTSLKGGALAGEPPLDDKVANEALLVEEVGGPLPQAKQHSFVLSGA